VYLLYREAAHGQRLRRKSLKIQNELELRRQSAVNALPSSALNRCKPSRD